MAADTMSNLESGEDGLMVLLKKRLTWWTPTKTAAFVSLDDFQNIEKRELTISSLPKAKTNSRFY